MTLMTADALESVGICGTNVRKFRQLFPETDERYFDGVEVTREVCESNHDKFSWNDAASYLLSHDGQRLHVRRTRGSTDELDEVTRQLVSEETQARTTYQTRIAGWRVRYSQHGDYPDLDANEEVNRAYRDIENAFTTQLNDINVRRLRNEAGVFGELLADPTYHSDSFAEALRASDQRRDRRQKQVVRDAENALEQTQQKLNDAHRTIETLTPRLPELRQQVVEVRVRYHDAVVRRAELRLAKAVDERDVANRALEELRASTQSEAADEPTEAASTEAASTDAADESTEATT